MPPLWGVWSPCGPTTFWCSASAAGAGAEAAGGGADPGPLEHPAAAAERGRHHAGSEHQGSCL